MPNLVLRRKRGERVLLRQRSLDVDLGTITVVEVEPQQGGRVKLGFELLADIGPREELPRQYRTIAKRVRGMAARLCVTHPERFAPAERLRALCGGVLTNRFLAEADWRGEDYEKPLFWLGPRPYQ